MDISPSPHPNERLRQERLRRNWRQQDVANQLGTTVTTIKRWESGRQQPSVYFRIKLCALFDKSTEELGFVPEARKDLIIQRSPEVLNNQAASSAVQPSFSALSSHDTNIITYPEDAQNEGTSSRNFSDELEPADTEVKVAHALSSSPSNIYMPLSKPPVVPIKTPALHNQRRLIGSLVLVAAMIIVFSVGTYAYLSAHAHPIQTSTTAVAQASRIDTTYNKYVTQQGMMFGFGPQHTRKNPYEHLLTATNVSRLHQKWSAPVVSGTQFLFAASPTVANDIVYVSSADDKLYAFDALTGRKKWSSRAIGVMYSSPAVNDDIVYIGSDDDKLYALDALTGQPIWSASTSGTIYSSPTIANGIVYVGSQDHHLYAFDALTGQPIWSATAGGGIGSSPAVANGIVYVGSDDSKLYAFDALTGQWRWSATTGARIFSSPAIANGIVYVGSWDNKLYALDALTGQRQWSFTAGQGIESSPAVANGIVYVGSWDNKLYALDALTGQSIWSFTAGDRIESSPVVANGIVYVGSADGKLYALGALTGQPIWSATTGDMIGSSPAVANGIVYVGSHDNKLYAFSL